MEDMKVLFHVSDNESWKKALVNIGNFLKDVDEKNAQIEVVANASAVTSYYGEPDLIEQMNSLSVRGVRFVACRNALAAHSLDEKSLPPFVHGVPGGITEIVARQNQGYAYIKP